MTPIPLLIRLRGLLARDKDAYWWKHFTDEELKLRSMDVWQLAGVIEESEVGVGMARQKIVAEHILSVRLAAIQAKASWGAGVLGFVGAVVGGTLTVALAPYFQATPQSPAQPAAAVVAPRASSESSGAPSRLSASATAASPASPPGTGAKGK